MHDIMCCVVTVFVACACADPLGELAASSEPSSVQNDTRIRHARRRRGAKTFDDTNALLVQILLSLLTNTTRNRVYISLVENIRYMQMVAKALNVPYAYDQGLI